MATRTKVLLHGFTTNPILQDGAWPNLQWQPRVDVYQGADCVLFHIEAAGLDEENVALRYDSGQLIVEGNRKRPPVPERAQCWQVEISYGPFQRTLPLPGDADTEAITAEYRSGVLQISVPRRKKSEENIRVQIQ